MNQFKLLEKANKYHEQIKKLDKEIIEIDRIALLFAQEEQDITIDMCTFFEKEEQKEPENEYLTFSALLHHHHLIKNTLKNQDNLKTHISNNAALQMLGILLHDKYTKRDRLILKVTELLTEAKAI